MKKQISLVLALLMILLLAACQAPVAGESPSNPVEPPADSDVPGPTYTDDSARIQWNFDAASGTLTFSGSGPLADKEPDTADHLDYGWTALADQTTSIVIGEGISRIPNMAFYGFSKATEVSLPSTLKSIGVHAFFQCAFTDLTLPSGLEVIDKCAFSNCQQLRYCDIPAGVKVLESGVFEECIALQFIALHEGLQTLEDACLWGCDSLNTLIVPASVTQLEELYASGLKVLVFLGDPPEIARDESGDFLISYVTVYYPEGNAAWQNIAEQGQRDDITWIEGIPEDGE